MATNTIICGLDTLEGRKFFRQSLFRLYSKWETLNEETSQKEQDIIIKGAYINCTSLNDLKDNILYKILCDDNNLGLTDNKGAFSMYRSYSNYETSILYMPNKIKINNRYLKSFLTDVKEDKVVMSFERQNAAKFRISFGRIENDGYGNREIVWDNPIYFNDGTDNSNAELLQLIAKKENNYEVAVKIELNNGVKKIIKASELTKIEIVEYEHNYGDDFYFIGWDENKREFTSGAAILNDILNFIDLNNPDEQREFQPGEVNFIGSAFRIEAKTGSSYDVEEIIPIQFFQPYKWGRQSYFVENLEIPPGDLAVVFWEKDLNQYVYLKQGDNKKFGYVCFGPSGSPKIETIHCIGHYDHLSFYLTPDENKTKPLMFLSREQEASGGWYAIYNNPYTIGLIDYFANNPILDDSLQNFILQKNQEKNIYSLNDYFKFVSLKDKNYAESNEEIVFGYIPKVIVGTETAIDILTKPQPYYFLNDPSWKERKGSIIYAPEKIKPAGTTHYLRLPFLINSHFNVVNLVHHIINNKVPKIIWNVTVQKDTTVDKYDAKWTVLNEDETETIETKTNITANDKAFNRIKIETPLEITNITYANHYTEISSRKVYSNYDGATVLLRGNLASWTAVYTIDTDTIKRVNYQILDSDNNIIESGYTYNNSLHISNINYKVKLIGVPKDNTSYVEYSNPTNVTIDNSSSSSPEIKANKKEFFFFSTKLKVNGEEKPSGVSDIKFTLKKGTTTLQENKQTISNYRIEKDSTINYTLMTNTSIFYDSVADRTFNGNQNQNFILETSTTEKPVPKIIWSFDPVTKKLTFRKEVPESFPTLNYTVTSEYLGAPKQITDSDKSYTIQVKPQDVITLTFSRPMTGIYPKFEETITFSASWESQGVQKDSVVLYPTYTVRFYDFQGTGNTLLKTETVISGGNATPPADPVRTGYEFTGWSSSYTNITTNTDIYGQWVSTYTNYVRFVSGSSRIIIPKYTNSGITLQYSVDNGATWTTILSGRATTSATEHWFRGRATGTKSLFAKSDDTNAWAFSGSSDLEVYGNLNFLLCDTLGDEEAPISLDTYAYTYMFQDCTSLTTAPELPATTLANYCYTGMFNGCTSLTTAPELPATTMASLCYAYMFRYCTSLKVSATKTGAYTYAWRIPTSGTGVKATNWNTGMLQNTGGTFTSNPTINKTYYVQNQPV